MDCSLTNREVDENSKEGLAPGEVEQLSFIEIGKGNVRKMTKK